ncbi:hypothetical protein BJ508DRAFT_335018 [Ascobolus immersus RN42]|uniref:Uncharacterized protein n=1 Tax=Ascobolus immersus RN42 TaxID=1160509 RepID=A0A3N4HII8_ASCIM|nr:hypothetical protein BJ508DRAFT_335018 [Ascobolus immersus RN42]
MAFVRDPSSGAEVKITPGSLRIEYVYNRRFLFTLLLPLFAMILGWYTSICACGNKRKVPGYDPLMIAAMAGGIEGFHPREMEEGYIPQRLEKYRVKGSVRDTDETLTLTVSPP